MNPNYKLLSLLLILASPTLATKCPPLKSMPCPCKPAWSFYGGFAAGLTYLEGNWNLGDLTLGFDRTTKQHLTSRSGRFEVYFGSSWNVPSTDIGLGLEPYFTYYNLQQSDFNPRLLGQVGGVNVYDSISQKMNTTFALGLDFRPSYQFDNGPHSVYGLIGASVTQLSYTFQDQAGGPFKRNKYPWGLNWGLGYKYQMNASSIGFRFRDELYNQQTIHFANGGSNFSFKAKPTVYSFMLTYEYNFQ